MKTAGRENPNRWALCPATELMVRKIRTTLAQSIGLRSKKIFQPTGTCFSLTSKPESELLVLPSEESRPLQRVGSMPGLMWHVQGVELPFGSLQVRDIHFREREEMVCVRCEYRRAARSWAAAHERSWIAVVTQPKHMTKLVSSYVSKYVRQ